MKTSHSVSHRPSFNIYTHSVLLSVVGGCKQVWQRFIVWLASGNELQVWQSSKGDNDVCWHAYDPATGRSICVASDTEMREWIERRYYQ